MNEFVISFLFAQKCCLKFEVFGSGNRYNLMRSDFAETLFHLLSCYSYFEVFL